MCCAPHTILKNLNSSVVSLAQLVSPSVALPAQLVVSIVANIFVAFILSVIVLCLGQSDVHVLCLGGSVGVQSHFHFNPTSDSCQTLLLKMC